MKIILKVKVGNQKINMNPKIKMLLMYTKKRKIKMKTIITLIRIKKILLCKILANKYQHPLKQIKNKLKLNRNRIKSKILMRLR